MYVLCLSSTFANGKDRSIEPSDLIQGTAVESQTVKSVITLLAEMQPKFQDRSYRSTSSRTRVSHDAANRHADHCPSFWPAISVCSAERAPRSCSAVGLSRSLSSWLQMHVKIKLDSCLSNYMTG